MACFHVFFFNDVIEIGQLVGYFEKQAIHRINGYFDVTVQCTLTLSLEVISK